MGVVIEMKARASHGKFLNNSEFESNDEITMGLHE
jgi:hypothetical protein